MQIQYSKCVSVVIEISEVTTQIKVDRNYEH
jgi:hypothetical protein